MGQIGGPAPNCFHPSELPYGAWKVEFEKNVKWPKQGVASVLNQPGNVMRCFYAQHGSTGTLRGERWGATRPLRCGASRCSCRRSSRPAPGSSDYIHLDYMLPTLFGARRDHMLAMT